MTPVFVKPRTPYDSYQDFWTMVACAGFEVCHPDQVEWDNLHKAFIVTPVNGEVGPEPAGSETHWKLCKFVWWNLERYHEGETYDLRFDEIWVSDRWYASKVPGYRYVDLGTEPGLATQYPGKRGDTVGFDYDVGHLSYLSHRRQVVIPSIVEQAGWRVMPNAWGEERHRGLLRTGAILNTHQDEHPQAEPLRLALAAAYDMGVWTEPFGADPDGWRISKETRLPGWWYMVTNLPLMGHVMKRFRTSVLDEMHRLEAGL